MDYYDINVHDTIQNISRVDIEIPSGTYVKKIPNGNYQVNAWRGMPKEYREAINSGVFLTYAQVKGKFN
jgi:hypothetical protein